MVLSSSLQAPLEVVSTSKEREREREREKGLACVHGLALTLGVSASLRSDLWRTIGPHDARADASRDKR